MLFAGDSVNVGHAVMYAGAALSLRVACLDSSDDAMMCATCIALSDGTTDVKGVQFGAFSVNDEAHVTRTLVVVRTDTMALLWHVTLPVKARVVQAVLLSADALCGLAQYEGKLRLFMARRKVVHPSKEHTPSARFVFVDGNNYASLASAGNGSDVLFVLTKDGTLYAMTYNDQSVGVDALRKKKVTTMTVAPGDSNTCICVAGAAELHCVSIFSEGSPHLQLIAVKVVDGTVTCIATANVECTAPLVRVDAASEWHFAIIPREAGEDRLLFLSFNVHASHDELRIEHHLSSAIPSNVTLLGVCHEVHSNACVVYATNVTPTAWISMSDEAKLRSLMRRTLSLDMIDSTFNSTTKPTMLLRDWQWVAHHTILDGDEGALGSVGLPSSALIEGSNDSGEHTTTNITLCYALDVSSKEHRDLRAIAVSAPAHIHTRLAKQWPRASTGLRHVLLSDNAAVSKRALTLPWNPRHMRRVLRGMSQGELSGLFRRLADTLRGQRDNLYPTLATATVDMAVLLITLSRSMGVELPSRDVQVVAALLRASRAVGHDLYGYTSRMELLTRSFVQRRAVRQLLRRGASRLTVVDDAVTSLEKDFQGIAKDVDAQRALQTRYTMNEWAERAAAQSARHREVAAYATTFLAQARPVAPTSAAVPSVSLSQWEDMGREHYPDAVFDEFESPLTRL